MRIFGKDIGRSQKRDDGSTPPEPRYPNFYGSPLSGIISVDTKYHRKYAETSSIVQAGIGWFANVINSAELQLVKKDSGEVIEDALILDVINRPHIHSNKSILIRQIISSLMIDGQSLLELLYGPPPGLQYLSYRTVHTELRNGRNRYRETISTGRPSQILPPDDIAQILYSVREGYIANGIAPLEAASLFLNLDRMAAMSATGRMQSPVLGMFISAASSTDPIDGTQGTVDAQELQALKKELESSFSLENAGRPKVTTSGANISITELNGQNQRFSYKQLHDLCEERICASMILSPAVLQLGTGLEQSKVATSLAQELEWSMINGAIPLADKIADALTCNVLPWFEVDAEKYELRFVFAPESYEAPQTRGERQKNTLELRKEGLLTDEATANRLGIKPEEMPEKQAIPEPLVPFMEPDEPEEPEPIPED